MTKDYFRAELAETLKTINVCKPAIKKAIKNCSNRRQGKILADLCKSENMFRLLTCPPTTREERKDFIKTLESLFPDFNFRVFNDFFEISISHIDQEFSDFSLQQKNAALAFIEFELSAVSLRDDDEKEDTEADNVVDELEKQAACEDKKKVIYCNVVRWLYRWIDNPEEAIASTSLARLVFETMLLLNSDILELPKLQHFWEKNEKEVKFRF